MKVLLALLMIPWVWLIPAVNAQEDPCADWNRAVGYVDGDCYYTTRSNPPRMNPPRMAHDPCDPWIQAMGYQDEDCKTPPPITTATQPTATTYQPRWIYEIKRPTKKGNRIVRIRATKAGTLKLKPGDVLTGSSFPPK